MTRTCVFAEYILLQCDCQHNTCGGSCDHCCPGFNQLPWKPATTVSANECEPCSCNGHAYDCYYDPEVDRHRASKNRGGQFEGGGVCIDCQHHTTGINCERCVPGYYKSPDHPVDSPYICYRCNCDSDFTDGTCEDLTGRCYCKPNYTGELCDSCADGYVDFPHCYHCDCNVAGTKGNACRKDAQLGLCLCKPNFQGTQCDQCAPGYYGPSCQLHAAVRLASVSVELDLKASRVISVPLATSATLCVNFVAAVLLGHCRKAVMLLAGVIVNLNMTVFIVTSAASDIIPTLTAKETGQCACRPRVIGQRCDTCIPGAFGFPQCEVGSCNPAGLEDADPSSPMGSCKCRAYVEGSSCDRCKPLYWNLTPDNPFGCMSCQCNTAGTIAGVAECQQGDGHCFCKPNTCGQFCSVCKEGYYNLASGNYFGCQECRCNIGGSVGPVCEERTGACPCRLNTQGPACNQPAQDHYIPDLHHLKYELEEGTTLDGRPVRFGYNPLEFENFSWRGYAQMSSIQSKVKVTVHVREAELYLFNVILRYVNSGSATVYGKITAFQPRRRGTEQTKEIVFVPSKEPTFVTVPRNSFGEPFVLSPSTWSLIIEAEGVLLDYLVLLPSSYYEARILQVKVSEPCTYNPSPEQAGQNCLLYKYLPVEQFPFGSGEDAVCRWDNNLPKPCPREQVTLSYPEMVLCSGSDVEVHLRITVPHPGRYMLLAEYASADPLQTIDVSVSSPQHAVQPGTLAVYTCEYSFLCRGMILDPLNRLAAFDLATEATIRLAADRARFFLYKVYLVPYDQFTMEFVEPKVHCISVHGIFAPNRYPKISQSVILEEAQLLPVTPGFPLLHAFSIPPVSIPPTPQLRPPTLLDSSADLILLEAPQPHKLRLSLPYPSLERDRSRRLSLPYPGLERDRSRRGPPDDASSGIGATGQKGHKRENGTERPVVAASAVEPGRHRFRDVDVDVASPPAGRNRNVGTEQLRRREVAPAVSETPAKQASTQNTPQKRSLPPKRSKPVDSASEAPLGTGASAPRRLRCRRAVAASSSFAFHSEPARRRRDAFAVDGSCSAPEVDAVSADSAPIDFGTTALLRAVAVPGDLPASPVLLS
ncbi:UNVERIFIED_CONTAM: hypothetical protein K2H54_069626 [Gekko kuhli]